MANNPDSSPAEIRFGDPLAEITRKERKVLLGISLAAIALVKIGLVPTRIAALGIEFTTSDQRALVRVASAVIGYFLTAFVIYAWSDYLLWKTAFYKAHIRLERISESHAGPQRFFERPGGPYSYRFVPTLRAIFEFMVPILVGLYALFLTMTASFSPPAAPDKPNVPSLSDPRTK